MKTRNIILLFTAMLFITACTQKPDTSKNQALVDSLNAVATTAWGSGVIDKVINIYADDAVVISGQIKMAGKDSIANVWKYVAPYAKNFKTYESVFSVSDDMVFIEGLFTFDWNKDNYSALAKGVAIVVWKKQADNTWKITYHEEDHGDLPK
jgi:ketosteroid isomerase-like protein